LAPKPQCPGATSPTIRKNDNATNWRIGLLAGTLRAIEPQLSAKVTTSLVFATQPWRKFMGGPRGQHTVPKSYLRKFVNRRNRLFVFDKKELRSFETSLDNIAKERDFYDLSPEVVKATGLPSKLIEGGYARLVDGTLMQDVHSFLKFSPMQLTDWDARVHVAQFITFQYLRTRTALNHAVELAQKFGDHLVDDLMKKNFTEEEQKLKPNVVTSEADVNAMLSMMAFDIDATFPVVSAIVADDAPPSVESGVGGLGLISRYPALA
jgi:hypothetical protein